jgi:hypothetical protein
MMAGAAMAGHADKNRKAQAKLVFMGLPRYPGDFGVKAPGAATIKSLQS